MDALNDTILFRWENMASIGVGAFVLSIFWRWSMERKMCIRDRLKAGTLLRTGPTRTNVMDMAIMLVRPK